MAPGGVIIVEDRAIFHSDPRTAALDELKAGQIRAELHAKMESGHTVSDRNN